MKYNKLFSTSLLILPFGFFLFLSPAKNYNEENNELSNCLRKESSQWGEICQPCEYYDQKGKRSFADTYVVRLQNSCNEQIDAKCCVQEENKSWRCFTYFDISPDSLIQAFACKGTGRYLYWTRSAGDLQTLFPENSAINLQYGKK